MYLLSKYWKIKHIRNMHFLFFPFKQTEQQQRVAGYSNSGVFLYTYSCTWPCVVVAQFVKMEKKKEKKMNVFDMFNFPIIG